ncbi:TPA: hypothetical protein ACGO97_001067 [Streptococcus suis]|jgi:hypothetical protein|uniref:hypothetical protein n=1 Tax=Streptococcus suis TaxID=1307 RepID=UPI000E0A8323|nr:hypothetical protein [Streptococcus suis]AXI66674.1 hypothetical protein DP112_00710 [Streptococcus suis]MBO4127659.1 hypothetical protein [Streptococcus suis]MCK3950164.1 hypothetical protein [Streptococcus suis]
MNYFQARISIETAYYFNYLKKIYQDETSDYITQAFVIAKAIDEISGINSWEKIISDNSIKIENTNFEEKDLRLRIQITPQLEETIKYYKSYLPQFIGTRSITLGVTLKFILKAVILLRKNPDFLNSTSQNIEEIFEIYEQKILDYIAPANHSQFIQLFTELKTESIRK